MGTFLQNKIVTRGFGAARSVPQSSGIIVRGFGPLPPFVIEALVNRGRGQSGTKRRLEELDEVIVWAKLVSVNDEPPPVPIKGWIRVRVSRVAGYARVVAEQVATRVKKVGEFVRITVSRLK